MANYNNFIDTISQIEGGYQNLKWDKGNFNSLGENVGTNFGISARVYETTLKRPPTVADMKAITPYQAIEFYRSDYWNQLNANGINSQMIAETFIDHAINGGQRTAAKLMQKTLNTSFDKKLVVDGKIGVLSLSAINTVNELELFKAFNDARLNAYRQIGGNGVKSWENRVLEISQKFNVELDLKKKH